MSAVKSLEEVALDNLFAAKSFLIWKTKEFYTEEEFFSRIRLDNAQYRLDWLVAFACSWCEEKATNNLGTLDMCCDNHFAEHFH